MNGEVSVEVESLAYLRATTVADGGLELDTSIRGNEKYKLHGDMKRITKNTGMGTKVKKEL